LFYGPVLSRRFGYSLGIDVVPFKICTYDCIYCQLGRTTDKTVRRKNYVDIDPVEFKTGLKKRIKSCSCLDYITFSGSGEPTLNSSIGRLIGIVKESTNIPVAILTGGGTLWLDDVICDIKRADIIKVSLDAPNDKLLKKINRPCREINFDKNLSGLKNLVNNFNGEIWIEIMVLTNINDNAESAYMFKSIINSMGDSIKRVHLNTAIRFFGRNPTENNIKLSDTSRLEKIKNILGDKTEIIGRADYQKYGRKLIEIEKEIVELLRRRPMEIKDIAYSLGININEVIKFISKLLDAGEIKKVNRNDDIYYSKMEDKKE
jgi:wyosine [tRNA(Phe)-imidazoG37] synthetase (radical SAM superfamily)